MRTLTRAGAVSAVAAAALLVSPAAHATAPGDNGTVKIHDATTGEELRKNEPHVCEFYLDAFGFDAGQQVGWRIEAWAPTADVKGETVKSGAFVLDAEGHGRTDDMTLPDGHYKLFWNFEGEHGSAKHKVFWTDCEEPEEPEESEEAGEPGVTPSESAVTPSESAPAGEGESPAASPGPSAGEEVAPSSSPSAQGGAGGDLAETGNGAPVGLLSAAAAALLAAGGYLVFRRRSKA